MTHDEIIAVVAAERDGKAIELCSRSGSRWHLCVRGHSWDFDRYKFRIAEPKWRDATIDDLHKCPLKCRVRKGEDYDWVESELIGFSFRNQSWWQTNDCLWHTQCQVLEDE